MPLRGSKREHRDEAEDLVESGRALEEELRGRHLCQKHLHLVMALDSVVQRLDAALKHLDGDEFNRALWSFDGAVMSQRVAFEKRCMRRSPKKD
jgi:hypothetical protein